VGTRLVSEAARNGCSTCLWVLMIWVLLFGTAGAARGADSCPALSSCSVLKS